MQRRTAQTLHECRHLLHAGLTGEGEALLRAAVEAVFPVQRVDRVAERHALPRVPCGSLADEKHSVDRVLIAHVRAGEIAIALFKAENIPFRMPGRFQKGDLLADIFEASQNAAQLDAIFLRDCRDHVARDDRRDGDRVFRHGAVRDAAAADKIKQNDAHLVAGDEPVAALAVRHGRAAAVTVRVGADEDIGMHTVAVLQAKLHRLPDLGVRVRAGREMAVRLLLLLDDGHVPDPELCRQLFDAFQSRAVERRIDELQIRDPRTVADALSIDRVHKCVQNLVRNIPDRPRGEGRAKPGNLCARKIIHAIQQLDHALCRLRRHLAAVGAIDLIAVIFRRIVAGRHADAKPAVQMAHRKAQRRHRLQPGIEIGRDAVRGKHRRRLAREDIALDAAVVADGNRLRQISLVQIRRDRLCGTADDIEIHPVRPGAEDAAQAGRAELQIAVKRVGDLLLVALHRGKLLPQLGFQIPLRAPLGIACICKFHGSIPPVFIRIGHPVYSLIVYHRFFGFRNRR